MIFLKPVIMKNNFLILIFLIYSLFGFAQKNCKVFYEIETTADFFEDEDPEMHGYDKKINEAMKAHAADFSFVLKIRDNESYFETVKSMLIDNDNLSYKLAYTMFQAKYKFYVNTTSRQKLTEVEAYGKKFIVLDSINDWQISKEQKIIGEYSCYKATTKKMVVNSEGTFITEIVAWFTTELPYSFGPIGYGGLPGLILELQDGVIKYKLKKINYADKIKMSKPTKGEIITNKELLEYGEKSTESRGW